MAEFTHQEVQPRSEKRFRLHFAVRTDVGKVRSENQDSYGYARTQHADLFVVADGMGGAGGGATASAIAVNIVTRCAVRPDGRITEDSLRHAIDTTHEAIFAASKTEEGLMKMGTTVVALVFSGNEAFIAHVGDSRLYLWREKQICQLTRDHTLVQELVDSGTISRTDAENHPMAHYLTRSLSPESATHAEVHTYPHPIEIGDRFLLCCDGLYNLVSEEDTATILSEHPVDAAAKILVDLANERGGNDNITVELIEVTGVYEDAENSGVPLGPDLETVVSTEYTTSILSQETKAIVQTAIDRSQKFNEESQVKEREAQSAARVKRRAADAARAASEEIEQQKERYRAQQASSPINGAHATKSEFELREPAIEVRDDLSLGEAAESGKKGQWLIVAFGALIVCALVVGAAVIMAKRPRVSPVSTSVDRPDVTETRDEFDATPKATDAERSGEELSSKDLPELSREATLARSQSEDQPATEGSNFTDVARVIAEASNLEVPPAPAISAESSAAPDQPIDWQKEQVAKENGPTTMTTPDSAVAVGGTAALDRESLRGVVEQKAKLREQIFDIDAKVRQLRLNSRTEAEQQIAVLETQAQEIDPAIGVAERNFETAKRRYQLWLERKAVVDRNDVDAVMKLADEVAVSSVPVKRRKEAFEITSLRYSDIVELWTESQGDAEAAARMAELARELRIRRANLEAAIIEAVDTEAKQALFDVSDWGVILTDLRSKKDRVQRHIGFLQGFTSAPSNEKERLSLQRELVGERELLKAELDQLSDRVSTEAELDFRRGLALQGSGIAGPPQ